jgi:hypothetical protein
MMLLTEISSTTLYFMWLAATSVGTFDVFHFCLTQFDSALISITFFSSTTFQEKK